MLGGLPGTCTCICSHARDTGNLACCESVNYSLCTCRREPRLPTPAFPWPQGQFPEAHYSLAASIMLAQKRGCLCSGSSSGPLSLYTCTQGGVLTLL